MPAIYESVWTKVGLVLVELYTNPPSAFAYCNALSLYCRSKSGDPRPHVHRVYVYYPPWRGMGVAVYWWYEDWVLSCVGVGVTDDCRMLSEQSERSVVLVSKLGAYIRSPVSHIQTFQGC